MKQFTATFFTILALFYLADRYTGFNMIPAVLITGASILLIFTVLAAAGGLLRRNLYSFSIIALTAFILISLLIQ